MIITDDSHSIIKELNEELKSKTVSYFSSSIDKKFLNYSPWMCLPCLEETFIQEFHIFSLTYIKGELITDQYKLSKITSFLQGEGNKIWESGTGIDTGLPIKIRSSVQVGIEQSKKDIERVYKEALSLISNYSSFFSTCYKNLVEMVIPLKSSESDYGFSTHFARGVIFKKFPNESNTSVIDVSIDLVHELGHQVLMIFQSADRILTSPIDQPIWSGIRKKHRPAIQAFQGLVALSYMGKFVDGLLKSDEFENEILKYCQDQQVEIIKKAKETKNALKEHCKFTKIGDLLFSELEGNLKEIE